MMICPKCGKDLTNAMRLLGNDVIALHERAHQQEAILSLLTAAQAVLEKSNEVGDSFFEIRIRVEDYKALADAVKGFENWRPVWEPVKPEV